MVLEFIFGLLIYIGSYLMLGILGYIRNDNPTGVKIAIAALAPIFAASIPIICLLEWMTGGMDDFDYEE